ncbi:MAG: TrpB-like pyridoxal phosphate-dependent enzyme [Candidatus Thermoplasmatota archaeon]|nr:TrpB-like pyridoxal phosphate-dependent enzyme [Candidatus Thermoplasmatota archaeon]MCL5665260.1 TrpB-like pyridoxal phosphate-dependent enzyme [Candidatus Thermoplasmatota archaeon]
MLESYREEIIPEKWYNIIPDLPEPLPPPLDRSKGRSSIDLLNDIVPKEILKQEFSFSRYVDIPDEVREQYIQIGRPTPLVRARNLEKRLDYRGKIFFKFEGATVTGSHKINTAIPQAYYAAQEGSSGTVTETGAGQWGTATALASSLYSLPCTVFMVRISYQQKPGRKVIMNTYGADVIPSPSDMTGSGLKFFKENTNHPGSLGIAISEAVEYAMKKNLKYMIGSVLNSAITHQSIIGLETIKQLELEGEKADSLIGCVGGGSNFSGFVFPFLNDHEDMDIIASTAEEVPKFTRGEYKYDYIDSAGILPQLRMFSLGADFVPPKIYSGGLRYHGASPSLSLLVRNGRIKAEDVSQNEVIDALKIFAGTQGIIAAPESGHAIASALRYIKANKNEKKTVVVNVSGHGLLDLGIFEGKRE